MKLGKVIHILQFILHISIIVHCKHVARRYNTDADDVSVDEVNQVKENMAGSVETVERPNDSDLDDNEVPAKPILKGSKQSNDDEDCWLDLGIKKFYDVMDNLDANYEKVRHDYQKAVGTDQFDKEMLKAILEDQGRAQRALHNAGGDPRLIPAGLNLGGYCMMRMRDSVMFLHRMKLRNSTRFRINYLHNDLMNMLLTARISLNDLHLVGEYERAITYQDPTYLLYKPTYGQVEILLKDAEYKMEGRYRLIKDRLVIELVLSDITVQDMILKCPSCKKHSNGTGNSLRMSIDKDIQDELVHRLKLDLDRWLKDYFNDYLTLFELVGASSKANFLKYDKRKALVLNDYVDRSINLFKYKLHQMRAVALKVPNFTLHTSNGMIIKLRKGVLRGLDSMHRRSMGTGMKSTRLRTVNAIIGFSNLKLEYKYEAQLMRDTPPLNGMFILAADELTALMGLVLVKEPEAFDLTIEFSQQVKPESLTVKGSINRRIANFKHLLENQIISIMSNTLIHHIRMLSYLSKCGSNNGPPLPGHVDSGELFSEESYPTHRPTTGRPTKLPPDSDKNRDKRPSPNKSDFSSQDAGNDSRNEGKDSGHDGKYSDNGGNNGMDSAKDNNAQIIKNN